MTIPTVSVVIPCFNGGRFLDRLLASLRAQTFRDFEIIIVDDGSTEQLTRDKLASLDASIRVIHQENRGLSGARNAGFYQARAALVLPLDCDDALEPNYLAETVVVLHREPDEIGFVFTHMRLVGTSDGIMARHFNRFEQLFYNRLPYCMLIRKQAWESVGGYDETMRDGYEDWEFNIRLADAGFRGVEIDKPLFIYTVSDEGMLISKSARMHATLWRAIREKHSDIYSIRGMLEVFRISNPGSGIAGILFKAPLFSLVRAVPDAVSNQILFVFLGMKRKLRKLIDYSWRSPLRIYSLRGNDTAPPMPYTEASPTSHAGVKKINVERFISFLRLVISMALILAAFYFVSTEAFLAALRRIDIIFVVLAILLFYCQVLVVSWRFQIVLRLGGVHIGYVPALEATALSVVASAVLFSPVVGIILRVLVLRHANCSVRTLVLATLFERLILLAVLVVASIISVLWLRIDVTWIESWSNLYWLIATAALLVAMTWFFAHRLGYIERMRLEWSRTMNEIRSYVTNVPGIIMVTFVTVVSHLIFIAAAIAAAHANHIALGIYDLSAAISATMFFASIPVAISGWGVREISLIWLLGHLGVDASTALAFSIVIGILSLLAAAMASAMSLVIAILRRRDEAAI